VMLSHQCYGASSRSVRTLLYITAMVGWKTKMTKAPHQLS